MDITRIYNYYPGVVLSELSDLLSEDKMANGNKLCVISYLSKTLRILKTRWFTNIRIISVLSSVLLQTIKDLRYLIKQYGTRMFH